MDAQLVTKVILSTPFLALLKTIVSGIILWFIVLSIKDYISSLMLKTFISNGNIISVDSYIEISGISGVVKEINRKYVKLENQEDDKIIIYYIPINIVVNSIIKKIQYIRKDDNSNRK